ncbi:MAG: 5-carboxymethyl-2-hydroxymuconate isomerase [Gammaproteobacteria bacterium]
MPHITIEYTANLDRDLNVPELIDTLHASAATIEAFPLAGLRTRAVRLEHFRFADGDPDNAFVHVTVRIAHGRSEAVREAAGAQLFQALCGYLQPLMDEHPLAASLDLQEMNAGASFKHGNIREHMARRQAG